VPTPEEVVFNFVNGSEFSYFYAEVSVKVKASRRRSAIGGNPATGAGKVVLLHIDQS